jgi:hypothetical protein
MTRPRSWPQLAGGVALLLALTPYVGAILMVTLAATGRDISNAATAYFVTSTATCAMALVLAVLARRNSGPARWGFALAMIYLATTGIIVGISSRLL